MDDTTTHDHLVRPTRLLDTNAPTLRDLVGRRGWRSLPFEERIGAVHEFVRDEIPFGYNADDDLPASRVLADGYGQCNTKTTLAMALLRASGIPCRFHAARIHKSLQLGVVTGAAYRLAPEEILHSWAEVPVRGEWKRLEGIILDDAYLDGVRRRVGRERGRLIGYAVGTDDLADPPVRWRGEHTEIQMAGVVRDHGTFDDPDAFYSQAGTNLSGPKAWWYRNVVRHAMNRHVGAIRVAR